MILVVGTGFIGAPLAERLHSANLAVAALNRTPPPTTAPFPHFQADISIPGSLATIKSAIGASPEVVINCASSGRGGPDAYRSVYLEGTRNLSNAFPAARIIFTSSTSVYAQTDGSWVDEDSTANPSRETGQILVEAESFVTSRGGTVARLSGIYGPGRSVLLQRYFEGRSTMDDTGSKTGGRYLNQAHRLDVVSALAMLSTKSSTGSEVYNVTDDTPQTQLELYCGLSSRFGLPLPPIVPPDKTRKRGWTNKRVSNRKLRSLGWAPQFPSYFDALDGDAALVPSIRALASVD